MREGIRGITVTVTTTTGRQVVISERRNRRENLDDMRIETLGVGGRLLQQAADTVARGEER